MPSVTHVFYFATVITIGILLGIVVQANVKTGVK
jgi:hypothetical protein